MYLLPLENIIEFRHFWQLYYDVLETSDAPGFSCQAAAHNEQDGKVVYLQQRHAVSKLLRFCDFQLHQDIEQCSVALAGLQDNRPTCYLR